MNYKSYLNNSHKNNEIAFFKYNSNLPLNVPNSRNSCFINALYFSSIVTPSNMKSLLKRREESMNINDNITKMQKQIINKKQKIKAMLPYTRKTYTRSKKLTLRSVSKLSNTTIQLYKQKVKQLQINITQIKRKIQLLKNKNKNKHVNETGQNFCNRSYYHYFKRITVAEIVKLAETMPLNTSMIIKYAQLYNPKNHAFVIYKNENNEVKIMKQFRNLINSCTIDEQCPTYTSNQLSSYLNRITQNFDMYIWIKRKIR